MWLSRLASPLMGREAVVEGLTRHSYFGSNLHEMHVSRLKFPPQFIETITNHSLNPSQIIH